MINKVSNSPMIYLIRHARSAYNVAEAELEQKIKENIEETPQYLSMKFDLKYEDCDIVEFGHSQCDQCKQKMKDVDVDLVIVSPMRRALSTCARVFNDHKSKAPVIVDPLFRQIMESGCDIGNRLRQSMYDYPNFDYSLIQNIDYWYIQTLKSQQDKKALLQKLKSISEGKGQLNLAATKHTLEYLKQLWERRKKDPAVKSLALSPVQLQKAKLKMLLNKYKSIAVVTHSENIKSYTGIKPPNCSVMLYKPEYFELPIDQVPHNYL